MKKLINQAVRFYLSRRMHRIERFMRQPEEVQSRVLRSLLERGRKTEFGRRHGFENIRNEADFARNVPIFDYEGLKNDIARMMRGERDVLIPGEVNWYAKSSGTTSDKSKFIPTPPLNIFGSHVAGSWDSLALMYSMRPDLQIFEKRNLLLPGSWQRLAEYPKTRFGDVSAVLTEHMPPIGRWHYSPAKAISRLPNFEEKILRTVETCSKRTDIVMFGGVPTWLIVLFRKILEHTGKQNLLEVWPDLQAYMHGGVGFEPYRQAFRELIPSDDFLYQEIYNASEGYFGATSERGDSSMLLLLDSGTYFEFIPMSDWESSAPQAVPIWAVNLGEQYALVITSTNGLMRYTPGDTVVFTSKNPYKFRISGRTKQFINAFGEEVMVGDSDKALAQTCRELDCIVMEYTAAPFYFSGDKGKGGHEWLIEFEKRPADLARFSQLLDENLQKINSDYEAKRFKSLALDPLKLTALAPGTFLEWMKRRGKFGGQNKVPRLANNRLFVDDILKFCGQG